MWLAGQYDDDTRKASANFIVISFTFSLFASSQCLPREKRSSKKNIDNGDQTQCQKKMLHISLHNNDFYLN